MPGAEYFANHRRHLGIRVTSPVNEHPDLPTDMQMFAQLVVDETIVQQTTLVDGGHTQDSSTWTFKFDCDVCVSFLSRTVPQLIFSDSPAYTPTFWITIMRKAQGIRLVGSIEIAHGEALSSGERRKRVSTVRVINH
jgi:hypothetical protein